MITHCDKAFNPGSALSKIVNGWIQITIEEPMITILLGWWWKTSRKKVR